MHPRVPEIIHVTSRWLELAKTFKKKKYTFIKYLLGRGGGKYMVRL